MKTKTINLYSFDELSEESQDKAIELLYDLNVMDSWWYESTYEDAERIGLKIEGFDIDRRNSIDGKFIWDATEVAHEIIREHGEQCDTYKLAEEFLKERDEIVDTALKDEDGEFEDERKLDNDLDECESEFERVLKEEYLSILRKEYEYLTSREQIIESINCNEYTFTEDGKLCN